MPFTLGGDGTILPPRKTRTDSSVVQTSQPAFVEPDLRVRAAPDGTQLPQGTPANVFSIARRKARTLPEAVQSAIARSGGRVMPLPNIRVAGNGASNSLGDTQDFELERRTPTGITATSSDAAEQPAESGGAAVVPLDRLCPLVFVLEAAKRNRSVEISGAAFSAEQVAAAAAKLVEPVQKMLEAGTIRADDYAACVEKYCAEYGCAPSKQAPVEERVSPEMSVAPEERAPAPAPAPEPPLLPPPSFLPAATDRGVDPAGPRRESVAPMQIMQAPPKQGSGTLWWLVALIAAGVIVKKLSDVKVVGAAMAGSPLIAELESDAAEHEPEEAQELEE